MSSGYSRQPIASQIIVIALIALAFVFSAMALIVEHGGGGSAAAAPIARDILLQALCNGTPPLEAYPAEQRTAIEEQRKTMVKLPTTDPAAPPRPSDTRA